MCINSLYSDYSFIVVLLLITVQGVLRTDTETRIGLRHENLLIRGFCSQRMLSL